MFSVEVPITIDPDQKAQEDQHNKDMIAKVDGTPIPVDDPAKKTQDGAPKLFAGKYKSQEELEQGYLDLLADYNKKGFATKQTAPIPDQKKDAAATDDTGAKKEEASAGADTQKVEAPDGKPLDISEYVTEYTTKGALSEESYTALLKRGIDRATVNQYIAGRQVLVERIESKVFEVTGSKDKYLEEIQWASTNFSEHERKLFNDAMNSMDVAASVLAAEGLHARYVKENGSAPTLVMGDSNTGLSSDVYLSKAELMRDMNLEDQQGKRIYDVDPAYRKKVMEKLGRSKIM